MLELKRSRRYVRKHVFYSILIITRARVLRNTIILFDFISKNVASSVPVCVRKNSTSSRNLSCRVSNARERDYDGNDDEYGSNGMISFSKYNRSNTSVFVFVTISSRVLIVLALHFHILQRANGKCLALLTALSPKKCINNIY